MNKLFIIILSLFSYSAFANNFSTLRATAVQINVGSGAVIQAPSGKKYVLTNWHVCQAAEVDHRINVTRPDGESWITTLVKRSITHDLCALTAPQDYSALKLAKEFDANPRRHTAIYTRGYPERILSESSGYVKKTERFIIPWYRTLDPCIKGTYHPKGWLTDSTLCVAEYENHITTLYVQPGSSGSSVVNANGELVGVVQTYKHGEGGGIITFESLKDFLKDL